MDTLAAGRIQLVSLQDTQEYKYELARMERRLEATQRALSKKDFWGVLVELNLAEKETIWCG